MSVNPTSPNRIGPSTFGVAATSFENPLVATSTPSLPADAVQISAQFSRVTAGGGGADSVRLPPITNIPGKLGSIGVPIYVFNNASGNITLYTTGNDTIKVSSTSAIQSNLSTGIYIPYTYNPSTAVGDWVRVQST